MNSSIVFSTIQLLNNNRVMYTMEIGAIDGYNFTYNSNGLSTLTLIIAKMNINDLNILVSKPYEKYILMARKETLIENEKKYFEIPAIAYTNMQLEDDGEKIVIHFS